MVDKKRLHPGWVDASGHKPKPKPQVAAKRQDNKNHGTNKRGAGPSK